ncbi:unnamed protein product, partial [marine sediment metagenome]
ANDTASNWNSTAITGISIECDASYPVITNATINGTSSKVMGGESPLILLDKGIKVNTSITDPEDNLAIVILEITPPTVAAYNTTPLQDGSEFYDLISLNETGQWTFRFYANDTAGNNASALARDTDGNNYINVFTGGVPTIALMSPSNNAVDTDANVTFNYNVTADAVVDNCSLIINGIINQTNTSIAENTTQRFTLYNMAGGYYNWSVNCTDSLGNENSSETRTILVDATKPTIWSISLSSSVALKNSNISISANVTDNINLSAVWVNVTLPNSSIVSLTMTGSPYSALFTNTPP